MYNEHLTKLSLRLVYINQKNKSFKKRKKSQSIPIYHRSIKNKLRNWLSIE